LSEAVYNGKWTEMTRLLTALREEAEADSRKSAILEVQKYLNNQWRGIRLAQVRTFTGWLQCRGPCKSCFVGPV